MFCRWRHTSKKREHCVRRLLRYFFNVEHSSIEPLQRLQFDNCMAVGTLQRQHFPRYFGEAYSGTNVATASGMASFSQPRRSSSPLPTLTTLPYTNTSLGLFKTCVQAFAAWKYLDGDTDKRNCCCTSMFRTTCPSTCSTASPCTVPTGATRPSLVPSNHRGQGSSFDGSINTVITCGPSIDGDLHKPSDIVTRIGPSESPNPTFQHEFVKMTSNPTQLLNSFNNATKGFYRHTVWSFVTRAPRTQRKRDQTRELILSVALRPIVSPCRQRRVKRPRAGIHGGTLRFQITGPASRHAKLAVARTQPAQGPPRLETHGLRSTPFSER